MKTNLFQQLALLTGFLGAGFLARSWPDQSQAATEAQSAAPVQDSQQLAANFSGALVDVSAKAAEGVVQVRTLGVRGRSGRLRTLQEGSGVIVRKNGVVVTNNHVVKDGKEYRVILSRGVRRKAVLLARDPEADLAVLRIQREDDDGDFHALDLESPSPQPGQIVMALGNPLGLGHTVTSGIVSGLGRSDLDIAIYEDFVQTDCVVNPGSSGGPLIDLQGRVVGITTAVGLESNGDAGIAFAIPCSMVRKVVADILKHGRVVRGWIGIEPQWWFDPESEEGFDGVSRVKIRSFPKATVSPAKEAGLLVGDVVLALDDRRLISRKDLMTAVAECAPLQTVQVQVWREGKTLTLPVTLAEREQVP